jgi:hypothetical protein
VTTGETPGKEQEMAKQSKSGGGSNQDRLSMSPLEIRRGSADTTDVDDAPPTLGFSELNYDRVDVEAKGTDPWAAPGSEPSEP